MTYGPGLIPTEVWDYSVGDVLRGVHAAVSAQTDLDAFSLPGLPDGVPVRSGRVGIVLALQTLGLAPGARVGVPLYCCPVVFKAIVAARCVPRFVDVDPATFCPSSDDVAAKSGGMDALIAVHMFGNVSDVPRLRAAFPGKPIVEDCAQSIGSTLRGQPTGRFGDLAVFSFRAGKYLSAGEGAAVFAPDASVRRRLMRLASALPAPGRIDECRHLARSYIRSTLRSRPWYGLAGHALWQAYNRSVSYSGKSPLLMAGAYRTDLALSVARLPELDAAIHARRAHAASYARLLDGESITMCQEMAGAFYNRYQSPMLCPTEAVRDAVASHLVTRGIDTSKPYSDIADVAAAHYGYAGDCPASEQVARRVLVVPSHERLTSRDVDRITREIVAGLHGSPARDDESHSRKPRPNPAHV